MNTEQFLMEYFRPGDTVEVDAIKLQNILKQYREMAREVKKLRGQIEVLETANEILKGRLEECPFVNLDIKA